MWEQQLKLSRAGLANDHVLLANLHCSFNNQMFDFTFSRELNSENTPKAFFSTNYEAVHILGLLELWGIQVLIFPNSQLFLSIICRMLIRLNRCVFEVCKKKTSLYICACVSMAFPLSGTHHPQRLMSLNTAQSELIKQTTETAEGRGEGGRWGGNRNKYKGGLLLPLWATGRMSLCWWKRSTMHS